jgi:SAM-dependent methyltransferase
MSSIGEIEALSRAYYDSIADDYDRQLDTPGTWAIRRCFWQRAELALPPAAHILDFGAGTGIDAEHFASLGHRVTAYDLSAGMLAILRRRCPSQVARGTIVPIAGSLDEAREAIAAQGPFDAIVVNFAVFTLLPRLDPVFRFFAGVVRPGGVILICMQNPWWWREMRYRSFWRALPIAPFVGGIRYRFNQSGYGYRHTAGQVRRAARPEFVRDRTPPPSCCREVFGRWSEMRLIALRRL